MLDGLSFIGSRVELFFSLLIEFERFELIFFSVFDGFNELASVLLWWKCDVAICFASGA